MKNKFIALALVTLSMVSVTSCTTNEDLKPKAENVQTTSITVPFKVDEATNIAGKNVNRGTLPITIDGINVTAASTLFDWTKSTTFTLFPDGTAGNETSFVLDNIAIGGNNITAVTTTDALPSLTSEATPAPVDNLMAKLRAQKAYAVYYGVGTANVVQGNPNTSTVSPITLATKDGRNIAVFELSDELKTIGVTAKITPIVPNSSSPTFTPFEVTKDNNGDIYWNPSVTTPGDLRLFFTVTLFDSHGVALPQTSQIPQPYGLSLKNTAATSVNTIYTISQDALVPVTVTEVFTAQWVDNDPTHIKVGN